MKILKSHRAVFVGIILSGAQLLTVSTAVAQSAQIIHIPSFVEVQVGDTFQISTQMQVSNEPISVADVHMVFDVQYLEVLQVTPAQMPLLNYHVPPVFDNLSGKIDMAAFQFGNDPMNGDYELVNITFRALAETPVTHISHPVNTFPTSLLAYAGENKLDNVAPLSVSIVSETIVSVDNLGDGGVNMAVWPNPAVTEAIISLTTAEFGRVNLAVYDLGGKLVEEIFEGEVFAGVERQFRIDVARLANGLYKCSLMRDGHAVSRSLVVGK